jgi:ribosomal protein L22
LRRRRLTRRPQNTREAANALRGMTLLRAKAYLENVKEQKEIVPCTRYRYGVGRHAQVRFGGFLTTNCTTPVPLPILPLCVSFWFVAGWAHAGCSARSGARFPAAGPRRAPSFSSSC